MYACVRVYVYVVRSATMTIYLSACLPELLLSTCAYAYQAENTHFKSKQAMAHVLQSMQEVKASAHGTYISPKSFTMPQATQLFANTSIISL